MSGQIYTFVLQRGGGALRQYIDLVRQTLSMKESVVEEIIFNTAHPEKTTHSLLVDNAHGELVGGICFSVLGILADIDLLVVKEEYHGRGIGSMLLIKCLECAQSYLQVRVAVVQAVDSAKPFYQRAGLCTLHPVWFTCLELFMRCRDDGDFQVFSQCSGKKRTRYLYRALRSMLLATSDIPKAIALLRQPKSRSETQETVRAAARETCPACSEAARCASTQCALSAGHSGLCSHLIRSHRLRSRVEYQ